jgi:hypothetical protein
MDRARASEARGRQFESGRAHHFFLFLIRLDKYAQMIVVRRWLLSDLPRNDTDQGVSHDLCDLGIGG